MDRLADRILWALYRGAAEALDLDALIELAAPALPSGRREAAVQAALAELTAAGQPIREVGGSYALDAGGPLHAALIETDLPARRLGRSAICFDELDSTNETAFDAARNDGADGLVVTAEYQRCGRGRAGRQWLSPPGANLLFSVVLCGEGDSGGLIGHEPLTIAAGLAVAEGIERACGVRAELKWPNDLLVQGRKLCGVLVELRRVAGRPVAVVGVGVNVSTAPPAEQTRRPATCLDECARGPVDRASLLRECLVCLDGWIGRLSGEDPDFPALHRSWLGRCGMIHGRLRVAVGERELIGTVLDVSPLVGLLLACDDGHVEYCPAGHATVLD